MQFLYTNFPKSLGKVRAGTTKCFSIADALRVLEIDSRFSVTVRTLPRRFRHTLYTMSSLVFPYVRFRADFRHRYIRENRREAAIFLSKNGIDQLYNYIAI